MVTRPSRVLCNWAGRAHSGVHQVAQQQAPPVTPTPAGTVGAGAIGAPTRGLGQFFRRTRQLLSFEPQFWPHRISWSHAADNWNRSPFEAYNFTIWASIFIFIVIPVCNATSYYCERLLIPSRRPLPGTLSVYSDMDDPDWRMKREMAAKEAAQGPRPYGYNRYLDAMKGIKVSDPAFRPYIPSEHGEAVGAHAGEIIAAERMRKAEELRQRAAGL